ncbi:MAG: SpoIVB peptidase S55 domain-containing protein [Halanaerobium sp.]
MKKYKFKHLLLTIILIILVLTPSISAQDFMLLEDVESGMKGYGKTVFSGTEVEEFPVEIISVMRERSLDENLILIKVGGNKMEEHGGIAAGMSGSPIYVDDKLIGAVGYGWNNSDHRYGLVTPIERMLDLFEHENILNESGEDVDNTPIEEDEKIDNDQEMDNEEIEDISLGKKIAKANSPIMVNGIKGRALERLENNLEDLNLDVITSPGIREEDKIESSPEAGDSVAVQLVRGDISVASVGTLTYVDQGKFLAFGHPFTNRGEVDYLLSRAYINGVIPSSQQPFKLGSPYDRLIGSVSQDRGAGVAGRIDKYPKITPLYISISEDGELKKEVTLQIVNDEYLFNSLANSTALQAVDSALDRIGPGSARSTVKVMGRGLPKLRVESTNMYYSQSDIGSTSLSDFSQLLELITTNPFEEVNLIDIRLELDFERTDSVALVQEAKVLNEEIYPGDELDIEVTMHKYRDGTETKEISLKLPEDVEPGLATLFIDGGYTGETVRTDNNGSEQSDGGLNEAEISGYKNFESMLEDYLDLPDNNDLIIQLYPAYGGGEYFESSPEAPQESQAPKEGEIEREGAGPQPKKGAEPPEEVEEEIKERYATDYVLEGSLNLDIEILEKSEEEEAEQETDSEEKENDETQNTENDEAQD